MTVVGYVRVSTQKQADQGISLEQQQREIERWCNTSGRKLDALFVDEGRSGRAMSKRPAFRDALAKVEADSATLVAYSLSRIARSTGDCIRIAARINDAGGDIVSIKEQIDTSSAIGKLFFTMLAAMAQFESDQLSERMKDVAEDAYRTARVCGRPPFGYGKVPGTSYLIPDKREQAILRLINWYHTRKGWGYNRIATRLNRMSIGSKEGGKWWAKTIKDAIKSSGKYNHEQAKKNLEFLK